MDRVRLAICVIMAFAPTLAGCGMAMNQGVMTNKNADDAKELNAPLAVGGSIQPDVQMDLQGTASPTLVLVSGRPEVVSADDGRLTGRAPGVSAILVSTKEGVVLDFYHLWVEQATRATLHRLYDDGRDMGELWEGIDLLVGESVVLTPKVYYGSQELAGTVQGQWSIDPPVVSVMREGVGERRRLVATSAGNATLTVKLANVVVAVPLRVLAATKAAEPAVARDSASPATTEVAQ